MSTPVDDPTHDEEVKNQVKFDFNPTCNICSRLKDSGPEISCDTNEKIMKSLKDNKASNGLGISAQHLKYGGHVICFFITRILNSIFRLRRVPDMFRTSVITPIYKNRVSRLMIRLAESLA